MSDTPRPRCPLYAALVASKFNRDLWRIEAAAERLSEIIDAFCREYTTHTVVTAAWAAAGVKPGTRPDLVRHVDQSLVDVSRFQWALCLLMGSIDPLGAGPPSGIDEADTPTVVAAG
jgi:hypothetical protein